MAVCTGVLICLLFFFSIRFKVEEGDVKEQEWDLATITAGDYTVELTITPEMYQLWKSENYDNQPAMRDGRIAPAAALKRYLIDEIEREIDEVYKNGVTRPGLDQIKISDINFSFNNNELIEALRKRGGQITANNFDGMRATQDHIADLIKRDHHKLVIPTAAFITFEHEYGKSLAEEFNKDKTFLGKPMKFKAASEPTDIIWENRYLQPADIFARELIALLVIVLLLSFSFIFIFKVSRVSS